MRGTAAILLGLWAILTAVPGCGGGAPELDARLAASAADTGGRYQLRSGDRLRVRVYDQPDLSGEVQVDGAGTVTLPLVGPVVLAGLSAPEAERRIADALQPDYLRDPQVAVDVLTHRPLYVLGEVHRPGAYPYSAGLTVIEAVALAGGFTYRARERSMTVIRRTGGGPARELKAGPTAELLPGDTLRVHQRYF